MGEGSTLKEKTPSWFGHEPSVKSIFGDGFVLPGDFSGEPANVPFTFVWDLGVGDYTFIILDTFGDGICCGFGQGSYSLSVDGIEIANGGEFDGKRILSAESVADMTKPLTATGKQLNYACGWQCNIQAQRVCAAMPVGSFGHGGAFATNGFIDPKSGIVTVFMVQNVLVPDSGKPRDTFQHLVMESAGITVPPPASKKSKK